MNLEKLSDTELIASIKSLVGTERRTVVSILRHLNEMDGRRIAGKFGFPSLFDYCVIELKYAQGETARRIHAARAASKYPILYRMLERGRLSLTVVSMLAPHLKWDNYRRIIRASLGRSTREVEALIASLSPVPKEPPERIRLLSIAPLISRVDTGALFPASTPASTLASTSVDTPAPTPVPVSSERPAPKPSPAAPVAASEAVPVEKCVPVRRVHFSFTGDEAMLRDYERAKELSRRRWPSGKVEEVFGGALKVLLAQIDPDLRARRKDRARRLAAGARTRNIKTAVKAAVWARDGGRCSFRAESGRTCGARAGLEFDHIQPWALGGDSSDPANIRLLCRAHNDLEARRIFGDAKIGAAIAAAAMRAPLGGPKSHA